MGNIINERISSLRKVMKDKNIDMYFIPTSDYHDSEYVNAYFRSRAWLSGFNGSAGLMVLTQDKAVVWSDGRYFIQAEKQLSNTCIDFYRQGEKEYPTTLEFIKAEIKENGVLGFDGKVVSTLFGENLERVLKEKKITIHYDEDLMDEVWKDRPSLPKEKIFVLEEKYAGTSLKNKVDEVLIAMHKVKANKYVLTSLDDIAYLLNIRGNDVNNNPVVLSYVLIDNNKVSFYVDKDKINEEVQTYLDKNNIVVKEYNDIYEDAKKFDEKDVVLVDKERCNYAILKSINKEVKLVNRSNPTTLMKAIKNSIEIENLRMAHIKDGVAVTKFMYYLKNNVGKIAMDELSADEYLRNARKQQVHFIEESFGAIVAYNANAAMMHYSATSEEYSEIKANGMLLVDSGGQYLEGTTDITRTFGLGEVKEDWKIDFTCVLKGMIQLSKAKFLEGCSGINLDILARQPLWERNADYKCGTGHGVGFLLNVHEGPHGIRWKQALNRKEDTPLMEGMVVTNEPGIYVEGSHGIRIENELVVTKGIENEYGQFMEFETITFAPIDLDLINIDYLDKATINWLNAYHKEVYTKIAPFLNEEEKEWLKTYTREV